VGESLWDDFSGLGLRLVRFYVNTISVPEEVEKMIDKSSGVNVFGGMDGYTRFKAAEALGDAAKAGGDNIAGAGVGLGAGMQLGSILGNALHGQQQQPPQQQQQSPQPAPQQQPPQPATGETQKLSSGGGGGLTRDQIMQAIDSLDMRFSMGEISEDNYNRLVQKWQQRLREMGG
jgi:membrane protease subunit (stomatin/prohibitin family)